MLFVRESTKGQLTEANMQKSAKRMASENSRPELVVDLVGARRSREAQANRILAEDDKRKKTKKNRTGADDNIPGFYRSAGWLDVRYRVLKRDGAKCACCGRTRADGVVMNVDHIKPRWKYPELELDMNNLQVLCSLCNQGKGGRDKTDWRNLA